MTSRLDHLASIVARLRGPDGCPWDKAQDLSSMRPYLLEETYEVLDAIDALGTAADADADALAAEELGDLLFVVLLLAQVGEDEGRFTRDDVASSIAGKMVDRHPHVFGGEDAGAALADRDPQGVAAWEARKAHEAKRKAGRRSRLDGVPRTLPSLLRAHRQGEKAAAAGFDWTTTTDVLAKVREELDELEHELMQRPVAEAAVQHEYGDLLLAMANLGRHLGTTPEEALREANDRFAERFAMVEQLAASELGGADLHELEAAALDALWEQAKVRLAERE